MCASNSENEIFGCIKDFTKLKGRRNGRRKPQGDEVIIGDRPDVRIANLLFATSVSNNWPSQRQNRFPRGYIKFENGKRFDLANQTVDGRPVYLFRFRLNDVTRDFWRAQMAKNKIRHWIKAANDKDAFAMEELIGELRGQKPSFWSRSYTERYICDCLEGPALGVTQLEQLAALVAAPSSSEDTNLTRKVA
jgi:hypothetical protein